MPPILCIVTILPAYGIIYAPSVVFMVLRFGVFVCTVDNALKTRHLGAIYFEDGESKT